VSTWKNLEFSRISFVLEKNQEIFKKSFLIILLYCKQSISQLVNYVCVFKIYYKYISISAYIFNILVRFLNMQYKFFIIIVSDKKNENV